MIKICHAKDIEWKTVTVDTKGTSITQIVWSPNENMDWHRFISIYEGKRENIGGWFVEKDSQYCLLKKVDDKTISISIGFLDGYIDVDLHLIDGKYAVFKDSVCIPDTKKEIFYELNLIPYGKNGVEVKIVNKGIRDYE